MKRWIVIFTLALMWAPFVAAASPEETAAVLSQLVINTRKAVGRNFTEPNKIWWLPNILYRHILARNGVLPAAIAGTAFHPLHKDGVVVLKMVVSMPRNPANNPDPVEEQLFAKVRATGRPAAASTKEYAYYARPIRADAWCAHCHGEPKGEPDPLFAKYEKEGWKTDEVIGAATARVKR